MAPRRKKKPEEEIAVIPVEKGVTPAGVPFVKAAIIRTQPKSRIPRDIPKDIYRAGSMAEPYLKPVVLAEFTLSAPTHGICINKKARLVAGLGIKIISKFDEREVRSTVKRWERLAAEERKEQHLERADYQEAKKKLTVSKVERDRLRTWIDNASEETTLREIIERGWQDFETFGNLNLEVLRDSKGEPAKLNHASSLNVRVAKDGERIMYLLPPYIKPVYFKRYGDPRHLNKATGIWRVWTGTPGEEDFKPGEDWGDDEASEILRYVSYSPKDPVYGIPTWYAAMADMLGGIEARDFMLRFFTDKAVPLYAVLLEGGTWNDEVIQTIQNFFRRELAGNYHATLALEIPTGGKITFEQVSPEPRWWPFILKYRDAVRDVIVSVHGLTPAIVGVIAQGNLGNDGGAQQIEMVKTTEIRPRQETLEWLLNTMLVTRGLNLELVMLKFDEIDTRDEGQTVTDVGALYSTPTRPTITTNEAREMLRRAPVDAEWADEILIQDPQFGLLPLSMLSEAVRQQAKAQQIAGQGMGTELQPGRPGAPPGAPTDIISQFLQGGGNGAAPPNGGAPTVIKMKLRKAIHDVLNGHRAPA